MAKTLEELQKALLGIVTFLPDADIMCLAKYAAKVPDNGIIVDIGTADGASAIIMALCSKPNVKVWTIDPQPPVHMMSRLVELDLEDKITCLLGKSEDVINRWGGFAIDLLFVDGMHTYEAVLMDISLWGAFVKDGSTVLIHDTLYYNNTIGLAAKQMTDGGLLEEVELLTTDIAAKNNMPVGMLVTKKLPWHK